MQLKNSVNGGVYTYDYDSVGNVVKDELQAVNGIAWNAYGKVLSIAGKNVNYQYDATGNRVYKYAAGVTEYYVRDAQGNVMATYSNRAGAFAKSEQHLYGSSRLGLIDKPKALDLVNGVYLFKLGTGYKYEFIRGKKQFELTNHLGNVLATISDKKIPVSADGRTIDYYVADVVSATFYSSYGASVNGYNFEKQVNAFNGQRRSPEISSTAQTAQYWEYDSRIGRRWNVDPKAAKLPAWSPYSVMLNNPSLTTDVDGDFPILINGRVNNDNERGSWMYWDKSIRETIKNQTGYYHSQFKYVDGDKGYFASTRIEVGRMQGKIDAADVYARLKESIKEGQITEQLQVITHSRGAAFGAGYTEGLISEIIRLADKDKVGFAYGKENIVEYSVNLASHQSNSINFPDNGSKNVNVSHVGDVLSGSNAKGNVINVASIPEKEAFDQHGNATYNTELNLILNALEKNTDKSKLLEQLKIGYKNYDDNRKNGGKSEVIPNKN